VYPAAGREGGSGDDLPAINPTTGMHMVGDGSSGIDMGGNLLGHHND
jgi:hypothetical protein